MERRYLLIDSPNVQELKLDGPALRIRVEGRNHQWFPLRRISLISCVELPPTGMEALIAIANQGIPVCFYSRSGKLLAQLIHPGNLPGSLSHWLESVPCDGELEKTYSEWLENQLRHSYGIIGCVVRDSKVSAVRAEAQLAGLAKACKCQPLVNSAKGWVEGLITGLIQGQGMRLGLSANSSQLARIISDLLQAGTTLGLTWLIAETKRQPLPSIHEIPLFCGKYLAPSLEAWAARALFTLANQLERCAMAQDTPFYGAR
jgi:hypothetical protein